MSATSDHWTSDAVQRGQTLSSEFDSLVGNREFLTASIRQKAVDKSLQLEEMKELLPSLIEACLDHPEVLEHLFSLGEMIETALKKYEQLAAKTPNIAAPAIRVSTQIPVNAASTIQLHDISSSSSSSSSDSSSGSDEDSLPSSSSSDDDSYSDWPGDDEPFECPICFDDIEEKSATCRLPECKHRYCKECMDDFLGNKIQNAEVLDLHCPDPTCKKEIDYDFLAQHLSDEMMDKFQQFSLMINLRTEPNARWCPRPGCDNVLMGEAGQGKIECDRDDCDTVFCYDCLEPWSDHEGKTCAAVAAEKKPDPEFEKWAKKNKKRYKACPSCNTPVRKFEGCNHVTCRCGAEWCWICQGNWRELGGYSHFDNGSCSMYSGSEKATQVALIGAAVITAPLWLPVLGIYKLCK